MSALSKMRANLFSAANENTLALANLKFDFSLLKVEAPTEFSGLGNALSKRRKVEAEDGPQHKTARKLSALFEQLVPSTPELIKAYGLRSSEIIQMNAINPVGTPKDGPFESFVGVDGTAIWAAATSGIPALGVYLLACLLARAWDAKEATSIWVELVEQRRKEIEYGLENCHTVSESSRFSIFQDIERSDLACWDASARAWLQSADQAKIKEQTQLMLVVKNVQLPFDGGASTYSKVIDAWRHAMSGLENLLCGRAQIISSRAVLLAFSAWHVYPDLIVLGKDAIKVPFEDLCVNPGGVGTIALGPRSDSSFEGTSWSLALSHLRYYGDPITVRSHTDLSRVNIDQLHIVALGSLFSHWDVSQRDLSAAAQWLVDLWGLVSVNGEVCSLKTVEGLDWLQDLAHAASQVVSPRIDERQEALQLLGYGQRRAKRFFGVSERKLEPFFGLAYTPVLAALSEEDNEMRGLVYLRTLAEDYRFRPGDAVIVIEAKPLAASPWFLCEFTTAVAHSCASRKRDLDGEVLSEDVHVTWRYVTDKSRKSSTANSEALPSHIDGGPRLASLHEWETFPEKRARRFADVNPPWMEGEQKILNWPNAPALFSEPHNAESAQSCKICAGSSCCGRPTLPNECPDAADKRPPHRVTDCIFWLVNKVGHFSLFRKLSAEPYEIDRWKAGTSSQQLRVAKIKPKILAAYLQYVVHPTMEEHRDGCFQIPYEHYADRHKQNPATEPKRRTSKRSDQSPTLSYTIHQVKMSSHGLALTRQDDPDDWNIDYVREIAREYQGSSRRANALRALGFATQVYRQLDGATISLKVVASSLDEAPWLDPSLRKAHFRLEEVGGQLFPALIPQRMPRENALSCIAHFESGTLYIPPEDFGETLAIASGNSIFVISEVVSDPFDSVDNAHVKRIIGNIGRPGISILIAPISPRIRAPANEYNVVNHFTYDGKRENNFVATSLHLSFTDWKIPLESPGAASRTIDQDAYFIESVISVLDSGRWVADLDILCIDFHELVKLESNGECTVHGRRQPEHDYTSIDNWEELLDGPEAVGIFRAHDNWAARLAAVSILCQKGQGHSIGILGPRAFCLECLSQEYSKDGLRAHESPLPSICID
ncbi:MAG: hypothetical protein Q9191_002486 [Dirinaria sp. TL-2023a]